MTMEHTQYGDGIRVTHWGDWPDHPLSRSTCKSWPRTEEAIESMIVLDTIGLHSYAM
jgi:hypothetical protein